MCCIGPPQSASESLASCHDQESCLSAFWLSRCCPNATDVQQGQAVPSAVQPVPAVAQLTAQAPVWVSSAAAQLLIHPSHKPLSKFHSTTTAPGHHSAVVTWVSSWTPPMKKKAKAVAAPRAAVQHRVRSPVGLKMTQSTVAGCFRTLRVATVCGTMAASSAAAPAAGEGTGQASSLTPFARAAATCCGAAVNCCTRGAGGARVSSLTVLES